MSEFKFACPVCGQHITAGSDTSGKHVECPTCFQNIVVPQAPASADSKLILSASQVGKPRPMPAEAVADLLSGPARSRPAISAAGIGLVAVALAAGAALMVFRKEIFKPGSEPVQETKATDKPEIKSGPKSAPPGPANTNWTLKLSGVTFPEQVASGRLHGGDFVCERATLEGGTLALREGVGWPPPLGITVVLRARPAEEWGGQSVSVTPGQPPPSPRVVMRWRDAQQQPAKLELVGGYAMELAFGQPANGRIPGKIYLCLPDESKSFVAGTFDAEIRKPPHRKPRPPKAPK